MNKKIEKAINTQINNELFSGYMYLSMSAYFENENLPGMATWMKKQALEEQEHAMKLYAHIIDMGGRVILDKIEKPQIEWKSPLDAFQNAYQHEQKVTKMIHDLVDLSNVEKDHATNVMLHWFVAEQVEEEASADAIVQKLKLVGDSNHGLLMLDSELGKRE